MLESITLEIDHRRKKNVVLLSVFTQNVQVSVAIVLKKILLSKFFFQTCSLDFQLSCLFGHYPMMQSNIRFCVSTFSKLGFLSQLLFEYMYMHQYIFYRYTVHSTVDKGREPGRTVHISSKSVTTHSSFIHCITEENNPFILGELNCFIYKHIF